VTNASNHVSKSTSHSSGAQIIEMDESKDYEDSGSSGDSDDDSSDENEDQVKDTLKVATDVTKNRRKKKV